MARAAAARRYEPESSTPSAMGVRQRKLRCDAGIRQGPVPQRSPKTQPRGIRVGERHGAVVVIARDPTSPAKHLRFHVRCDCGKESVISGTSFRKALSCLACSKQGKTKWGRHTLEFPLYGIWNGMRYRCRPSKDPAVRHWAGRGITVCPEWDDDFAEFERWAMANGYEDGLSIDRLDVDGNYEPGNCEWVTRSVNSKRCRAAYITIRRDHYEELLIAAGRPCPE